MNDIRPHLVILAAGKGTRVGDEMPKQFVADNQGVSLLAHSLMRATKSIEWRSLVIAAPPDHVAFVEDVIATAHVMDAKVVAGAHDRMDSLRRALAAISATSRDICVVHDGVRPFTPPRLFRDVIAALQDDRVDACWPMSTPRDTALHASSSVTTEVLPADHVSIAATPIAVRHQTLVEALSLESPTPGILIDRILRSDARWTRVENSWWNLKVTTRDDLEAALAILNREHTDS